MSSVVVLAASPGRSRRDIAEEIRQWQQRIYEWHKELELWDGCEELPGMALVIQGLIEEIEQRIIVLMTMLPS